MRVIFIRAYKRRASKYFVGSIGDFDKWLADELIEKKLAKEYSGPWRPITLKEHKMKFNLKDLHNG